MIEIKHNDTGAVLLRVDANFLMGENLSGANLSDANLSGANLLRTNLSDANLRDANLNDADLIETNLTGADLRGAGLSRAAMYGAHLSGADLSGADLHRANLYNADLTGAGLRHARLIGTNLLGTNLSDVDLSKAILAETSFADCHNLSMAKGLESIMHDGPSIIDNRTLRACVQELPDIFLEGVGYTREEIGVLRALYVKSAIQFYSAFISHAAQKPDSVFADRLYNDLRGKNVTCWHFRYDLQMGERWATQIEGAIKKHDKLILVCSKEGVFRSGVVREVIRAIEMEQKTGKQKLFPVRLDDFIISRDADAEYAKLPAELKRTGWLDYLREYQIGDFRKWKNHDAYEAEFAKLLNGLNNSAKT